MTKMNAQRLKGWKEFTVFPTPISLQTLNIGIVLFFYIFDEGKNDGVHLRFETLRREPKVYIG